jgi:proteasome lid subunit RPN8/RPN11
VIAIGRHVLDAVLAHARDEMPRECCGMLLGASHRITGSARAGNLAEGTTRFLIDPRDHIAAIREARASGLDVVGFYHSHPRSIPYPSETDVAEAGYAEALHLIVGPIDAGIQARLFTIRMDELTEIAFAIEERSEL